MSRVEQVRLDSGSWRGLVQSFASSAVPSKEVLALLSPLRDANPLDLAAAIDPEDAAQHKAELTAFVVAAVHDALADHVLCDSEVLVLRQVCRILRVEEGDLLAWQRSAVVNLLSREIQRLLEDDYIDASEALHKAKLQEVLGLNYDEFVALTAPEIDRVLIRLLHRVDSSFEPSDLAKHVHWFRGCVSALDTVYNFNPGGRRTDRSGYAYLLVNPAMPGVVKIGKTTRAPARRMGELSGATGVPLPFELLFEVQVLDVHEAERYVHDRLEQLGARVSSNREFFRISPSVAAGVMVEAREAIGAFGLEI
jgi:hypothetical protein